MNRISSFQRLARRASVLVGGLMILTPSLSSAALTHRWSFNGNLNDSVGGQTAQILDPDNNPGTGGAATLDANQVTLAGGGNFDSSFVDLGPNIFGSGNQVTFEIWATQNAVQNWGRIFDIGNGTTAVGDGSIQDTFIMSWTRGTTLAQDRIEYRLATSAPGGAQNNLVDDTNAPYSLGTEFHIVMSLDNTTPSSTLLTWYSAPSSATDLGPFQGSFTSSIDLNEFTDTVAWLGRSHWSGDATATASFNEFRVYDTVLTGTQLESFHDLGPNVVPEPTAFAMAALCGIGLITRRRRR
jgi:hypothetical protein